MDSLGITAKRLSLISVICFLILGGLPSEGMAQQRQSIIDRIQHAHKLRVCVAISVPWMMKDPSSEKFIGFDVDMMTLLSKDLGVDLDLVGFPNFGQLIAGLQADRCDLIAPFVRTTLRATAVAFTDTYFTLGTVWAVNGNNTHATTLKELDNPSTIVVADVGSSNEQASKRDLPHATLKSLPGGGDAQRIAELQAGRATAAALDSVKLPIYKKEFSWMSFIPEDGFNHPIDPTGLAYAVNREDLDFVNLLNVFIANLKANGTINALLAKWMDPKWFQH